MQCACVRQTDLPNTSKLFADLVYHFDRVSDLYPWAPNNLDSLVAASRFDFPDERRAGLVEALRPLNPGNPSLDRLAQNGTVAVVTGQQVGLFSGPAYTIYKALSAIRAAEELSARGVPAVPVFWLATEDHDLAEVDHSWVFDAGQTPVRLQAHTASSGPRPVGGVTLENPPLAELRAALSGLPYAEDAVAMVERAWRPGASMGEAFAAFIREIFAPWGLLLIDPMQPAIRKLAAPLIRQAVERMPELTEDLMARSRELESRGYHAQVLVDAKTSLVFLLENGQRTALRRSTPDFGSYAGRAEELSPNALLRPVVQDYLLPTAAYAGGGAELAYLAQSQVLYQKLLGRQPVAFPRSGFTLLDERAARHMNKYGLSHTDLFTRADLLHANIASKLVPASLKTQMDKSSAAVSAALDELSGGLRAFDISLAAALETSRRKIEYQTGKIARKTAAMLLRNNERAQRDASRLHNLVFPENHLQERLYSIVPFIAKFGPGLIGDLCGQVHFECPDHQLAII